MRTCILLTILLAVIITACGTNEAQRNHQLPKDVGNNLTAATWLLGEWRNVMPDSSIVYERWEKVSDTIFHAIGLFMKGGDTLSKETIVLRANGDSVYYIPTVANQNNGVPVPFKMVVSDSTRLVFENKTHDFPQRITYTLITTDSMVASISGSAKGTERNESFPMKRAMKSPSF